MSQCWPSRPVGKAAGSAEFDYVVVGGGSAGCVLASRLSEDPGVSVLLLEAGGDADSQAMRCPIRFADLQGDKEVDWAFKTERQDEQLGSVMNWPRGRCLGGTSSINAMIYVRGDPNTYDEWEAMGCEGWSYGKVLPFFKKAERHLGPPDRMGDHGASGPLVVRRAEDILGAAGEGALEVPRRYNRAMVEAGIVREGAEDYNSGPLEGAGGMTQCTICPEGVRCSTAEAYLRRSGAMARPNLAVWTHCMAERVAMEGSTAVGVLFREGKTAEAARAAPSRFVAARREVVLSAGAVQSPQLLMLSGIGPRDQLEEHGISVSVPLPGVGQRLLDHLFVPMFFAAGETDAKIADPRSMKQFASGLWTYLRSGGGFFGAPPASNLCFIRSGLRTAPDPHADECDLQLHLCSCMAPTDPAETSQYAKMNLTGEHGEIFSDYRKLPRSLWLLPTLNLPKSEGSIQLRSADPFEHPRISPGYLSDPYDRKALVEGLKKCRAIAKAPALSEILSGEVVEPRIEHPRESDEYLEEYVRRFARTMYHPMGTCRMGPDSDTRAVLDAQCRVRGAKGLRVVDASVAPSAITGNTNAPVIMIAEKIAADILGSVGGSLPSR